MKTAKFDIQLIMFVKCPYCGEEIEKYISSEPSYEQIYECYMCNKEFKLINSNTE